MSELYWIEVVMGLAYAFCAIWKLSVDYSKIENN
jgi:hypothetical protein